MTSLYSSDGHGSLAILDRIVEVDKFIKLEHLAGITDVLTDVERHADELNRRVAELAGGLAVPQQEFVISVSTCAAYSAARAGHAQPAGRNPGIGRDASKRRDHSYPVRRGDESPVSPAGRALPG